MSKTRFLSGSTLLVAVPALAGALSLGAGCGGGVDGVAEGDADPEAARGALSADGGPRLLSPLSSVRAPAPSGRGDIIAMPSPIRLGKALFWDVQVGSDGQIACASCHFAAGADARTEDTLNPGPDG